MNWDREIKVHGPSLNPNQDKLTAHTATDRTGGWLVGWSAGWLVATVGHALAICNKLQWVLQPPPSSPPPRVVPAAADRDGPLYITAVRAERRPRGAAHAGDGSPCTLASIQSRL